MQFTLLDFFTGFFLMNAMPHLLFGLFRIRFFSAFGFSPLGNLAYAAVNAIVGLTLFHIQHGIQLVMANGIFMGAAAMLLIYAVSGRFFYNLFQQKKATG